MSIYMFMASDKPLDYFTNTKKIELDTDKPLLKVERLYSLGDPEELYINPDDYPHIREQYTDKKYGAYIGFTYSDEVAEIIIQYIERHLETVTKEIELWCIWDSNRKETNEVKVKKCNLDDLTIEHINNMWGKIEYIPQCLKIHNNNFRKGTGYKKAYWE